MDSFDAFLTIVYKIDWDPVNYLGDILGIMEFIYGFKSCAKRAMAFRDNFHKLDLKEVKNPDEDITPGHLYFHARHSFYHFDETKDKTVDKYYEADDASIKEWEKRHNCRGVRVDTIVDDRAPDSRTTIELKRQTIWTT